MGSAQTGAGDALTDIIQIVDPVQKTGVALSDILLSLSVGLAFLTAASVAPMVKAVFIAAQVTYVVMKL
jgi:hypothetical protein